MLGVWDRSQWEPLMEVAFELEETQEIYFQKGEKNAEKEIKA